MKQLAAKIAIKTKYPKLMMLFIILILVYILFCGRDIPILKDFVGSLGYIGVFTAGFFYAYGFTAFIATAILILIAPGVNIYAAGILAGAGALISDLLLFLFVRDSFFDEIRKFSHEKFMQPVMKIYRKTPHSVIIIIASLLILSPLPTEIGVAMLTTVTKLSTKQFAILAYLLHTIGIFSVLLAGVSLH